MIIAAGESSIEAAFGPLLIIYSDFANVGAVIWGTVNTGINFVSNKEHTLGTITLPAGKWLIFARLNIAYNSQYKGAVIDFVITSSHPTSCALHSPQTDHWDRQTLVSYEAEGGKTILVSAMVYGELATDQISCQQFYAVRIK